MCGILGIVNKNCLDEKLLTQMRDTMVHRGPDDAGVWISSDRKVGLAHRRLSIIDLSKAGRQPMADNEGNIRVVYNGEIYNFQEISGELKEKGYNFKSHTDTEVIINAYKEWGTDCLKKFNGMFAFGIYDDRKKIIFLARDRLGKKPLYYIQDRYHDKFAFASELKALIKGTDISKDIDFTAMNHYFTFGYIPDALCIFKSIRKLPPAHAMICNLNSGQSEIWNYWDVPLLTERSLDENELLERLEPLLMDAVKLRMISDVPLGAFLSGGIDSSLVVAMMSMVSDKPVKTFSIGFEDAAYNELPYAKIVADYFATEHEEIIVKPDAFSLLPELVRHFDEPFADSSMLPTYYVSKATRKNVTVALSGDGGDEIFGGYKSYLFSKYYRCLRLFIPKVVRKGISGVATYLPDKSVGKRQLIRLGHDLYDAIVELSNHMFFKEEYRRLLLNREILETLNGSLAIPELSRHDFLLRRKGDFVNSLTYTDLKTYLPDDILVKVDRASMMVSLEVRAPLLDYRIAEFSFQNVPGNLKVKKNITKYLLKKLAGKILPNKLDINRKRGFAVPVSNWFRGPLSRQIKEILLDDRYSYFNQDYIKKMLDEHISGLDHSARLFSLLVFYFWEKEYLASG